MVEHNILMKIEFSYTFVCKSLSNPELCSLIPTSLKADFRQAIEILHLAEVQGDVPLRHMLMQNLLC